MKKIYNFYKKTLPLAAILFILSCTCFSVMAQPIQFTGTWANLKNYIENLAAGSSVEIELANTPTDVNSTIVIQANTSVTLRSDVGNRVLEKTTPDRHFKFMDDASLTLENITLDGGGIGGGIGDYNPKNSYSYGPGTSGGDRTTLTLNSGAIIQNCRNSGNTYFNSSAASPGTVYYGGGVGIYGNGSIINVNNGAIIRNNTSVERGGGIGVYGDTFQSYDYGAANATLNINAGALISGNTALNGGGGGVILQAKNSSLTISGGVIQGNYCNGYGGGVVFIGPSGSAMTLIVKDGAVIGGPDKWPGGTAGIDAAVGNFAAGSSGMGGGISAAPGLNLSNCTISGNTAAGTTQGGGGIFLSGGGLLIQEGTVIKNNTSNGPGGGLYSNAGGTYNMTGGLISGNTATAGGGIYLTMAAMNISGGTIQGNYGGGISFTGGSPPPGSIAVLTVSGGAVIGGPAPFPGGTVGVDAAVGNYGGGVRLLNYTRGIFGDCTISYNETAGNGGGISDRGYAAPTIIQAGAKIINNKAAGNGGGVYEEGGILEMTGGLIDGNTADGEGGGIYNTTNQYSAPTSAVNLHNGIISNNTAGTSGGGVASGTGYVTSGAAYELNIFSDAQITGNTANAFGGGVYTSNNSLLNITGGLIHLNTALRGGGIYSDAAAGNSVVVDIDGATTISNNKATGTTKTVTTPPTTYSGDGGGGIYITNLKALTVGADVTFFGNTANKPYWLELNPEDTLYDPGTGGITAEAIKDLTLVPNNAGTPGTIALSAPPVCNFLFQYPYNNYDINYIGTKDSNEEIYYHETCSDAPIIFEAGEKNELEISGYQWVVNGVELPSETNSTYTHNPTLGKNDTIYCIIFSDEPCVEPTNTPKYIITLLDAPKLSLATADTIICDTLPVIISGNTFGGMASKIEKITVSGSLGGTVNWSMPGSPFSITYTPVGSDTGKTVVLTVTTDSIAPCPPAQKMILLHINAKSVINLDPKISDICSEETLNFTVDQANITGWTRAEVAGISNPKGSGTGNSVSETLINTTKTVIPVEYLFTINTNGCISTGKVTILVKPKVTVKAKILIKGN